MGDIAVEELPALMERAPGSLAASYLRAYHGLCAGEHVDFARLGSVRGHDALALGLASVALSAGRPDDLGASLGLCSFDASQLADAARKVIGGPRRISERMEIGCPGEAARPLVGLVNFEHAYGLGGYQAAVEIAQGNEIAWNPIALEKRRLAVLAAASMDAVADTISHYRQWFPAPLRGQFEWVISMALMRPDGDDAQPLIDSLPEDLRGFAEDFPSMHRKAQITELTPLAKASGRSCVRGLAWCRGWRPRGRRGGARRGPRRCRRGGRGRASRRGRALLQPLDGHLRVSPR